MADNSSTPPDLSSLSDPPATSPRPRSPRPRLDIEPWRLVVATDEAGSPVPLENWSEVFGNDHPVEFEVGSGKGLFLANAAAAQPDRNYLGIEISAKFARKGLERLAKKGLRNAKILIGDVRPFIRSIIPDAGLSALHIYFPDPWWKKRHKKRRVFCEEFVDDARRVLKPGGDFLFATDVEEYFGVMMEIMNARTDFEPQARPEPKAAEHEHDYLTNFERKYRLEGRPIHRAAFRSLGRSIHVSSPEPQPQGE